MQAQQKQYGFTLIELLVIIGLIGVLAALAIPEYAAYRDKALGAAARTDLRTVATAEEAYYADHERYLNCTHTDCAALLPGVGPLSRGVQLQITGTTSGFLGTSSNTRGSGAICTWDKNRGGLVECR